MFKAIYKNPLSLIILTLYIGIFIWWIRLTSIGHPIPESYIFDWTYGLIGLTGALYGIFSVSKVWGGYKSVMGKGFIFISCGLLAQWLGLQIWTYYNIVAKVAVPYPSLADLGYFGLVPFYTLGALMLARASGAKFSIKTKHGKAYSVLIPLCMLILAYALFVKDIGITKTNLIKTFFDFGYPLGEIIPVSIALITFLSARKLFGGKLKNRIIYLLFAFSFQFLTEYYFLYTSGKNTYYNGSFSDLLYATSYTIMSLGLISFKSYES